MAIPDAASNSVVRIRSTHDVGATVERLVALIAQHGLRLFAQQRPYRIAGGNILAHGCHGGSSQGRAFTTQICKISKAGPAAHFHAVPGQP